MDPTPKSVCYQTLLCYNNALFIGIGSYRLVIGAMEETSESDCPPLDACGTFVIAIEEELVRMCAHVLMYV